ncbi:hypothetical protein NL676_020448 [Syzygium grande]|nr:hypothetical protein NL676_020448 [Syzygium grande]
MTNGQSSNTVATGGRLPPRLPERSCPPPPTSRSGTWPSCEDPIKRARPFSVSVLPDSFSLVDSGMPLPKWPLDSKWARCYDLAKNRAIII